MGAVNGIYGSEVTNDFKYFSYNCSGYYSDYQGNSKTLAATKVGDTLAIVLDLRPNIDSI
jgi:hypothetical protein